VYGFDWSTLYPVVGKVHEEIDEVLDEVKKTPVDSDKLEMEMGDLLFAVVNLSRHLGTHPEVALTKANMKFTHRFEAVEQLVSEQGKRLEGYDLEQLDKLWDQVKWQEMNKSQQ
jgi:ATP diphosphatase